MNVSPINWVVPGRKWCDKCTKGRKKERKKERRSCEKKYGLRNNGKKLLLSFFPYTLAASIYLSPHQCHPLSPIYSNSISYISRVMHAESSLQLAIKLGTSSRNHLPVILAVGGGARTIGRENKKRNHFCGLMINFILFSFFFISNELPSHTHTHKIWPLSALLY